MEDLIEQYTNADENARLTRQYITQMEYDTTMHAILPYLSRGTQVCELGAATGRYSFALAQLGCEVTAVELVPDQVRILRSNADQKGLAVSIYQGDACDVSFLSDESQDVLLILGPLYHLRTQSQREQAMAEARRVLKPDGVIAIAYISRYFIAGLFAQKFPELIIPDVLTELYELGTVSHEKADSFFRVGYFATPQEMNTLLDDHTFSIERHLATDGFGRYIAEGVNRFNTDQYQVWLQHHLTVCDEPSLLGSSNHGLIIGRKR